MSTVEQVGPDPSDTVSVSVPVGVAADCGGGEESRTSAPGRGWRTRDVGDERRKRPAFLEAASGLRNPNNCANGSLALRTGRELVHPAQHRPPSQGRPPGTQSQTRTCAGSIPSNPVSPYLGRRGRTHSQERSAGVCAVGSPTPGSKDRTPQKPQSKHPPREPILLWKHQFRVREDYRSPETGVGDHKCLSLLPRLESWGVEKIPFKPQSPQDHRGPDLDPKRLVTQNPRTQDL